MRNRRPLWECPRCGRRFVTRNQWHSCGHYRLEDHFRGKDPIVRRLFGRFQNLARKRGRVAVYAQKTRIVFQARVRFANVVTRQRWLDVELWLTRRAAHPKLRKVEASGLRCHVHSFRFEETVELDDAFAALVDEAHAVGRQEHRDN